MATLTVCDRCGKAMGENKATGITRPVAMRRQTESAWSVIVGVQIRHDVTAAGLLGPDLCEPCVVEIAAAALGNARWVEIPS